jgi:hypothetical protein
MKNLGIALIISGAVMMVFTGFNIVTKKGGRLGCRGSYQ